MSKCKICDNETAKVMSFGKIPVANRFLKEIPGNELFYNLSVVFCPRCFMLQLDETVRPEILFNDDYQFISSTSKLMAAHFKEISQQLIRQVQASPRPFIVELGCNDGIMLKHIAARGIRHLGVEPSGNVAQLARNNKVRVLESFFNQDTAWEIVKDNAQADIICGSNVFSHIKDIHSVFKGIDILLKKDGVVFFEDPYLLDIVKKTSFDQIYDEHVYFFSGLSISELAKRHNLQLVDMLHQDVHGGSMRYYIKKGNSNTASERVAQFLLEEKQFKLDRLEGYATFEDNVNKICTDLKNTLKRIKKEGKHIVGYGATSKSTTLLNYAQIGPELIDYICDITPNKINKYTPGTHIPIKAHRAFVKDCPAYTLLLAWNHREEIFEKEKVYRKKGGRFITYFPHVAIE